MNKGYSLALGGGAARGLSHVGVYKYLEEQNKVIDEVAGSSMGAVIAALIAIGKTSEEIRQIGKSINYMMFGDFDLKIGLIKGKKIEKKLEELLGDLNIEETKIPLKIVATNIERNETVVFTKGKIVDAVRASIAFPGIFVPKDFNGEAHVDGGLNMNLPVETLDGKNVIASSSLQINYGKITKTKEVFKVKFRSGFIKNSYETLTRSVILLMRANEDRSVNTNGKNVTLIRPDFGKLDILHFTKVDEFIEVGYNEAKKLVK